MESGVRKDRGLRFSAFHFRALSIPAVARFREERDGRKLPCKQLRVFCFLKKRTIIQDSLTKRTPATLASFLV